jgi:CHAT domain-containing protein
VVHIAAHGVVDEVDPLYSAIKLASGDIEAHEVYALDLSRANLIALSACSSGLGTISGGDEFWGFKRSFLVAGARTLLVSLWPVSDTATATLMQSFYRHYPSLGAAKAMQLAQLEMLKTEAGKDPLLWSPFVLVGDWR